MTTSDDVDGYIARSQGWPAEMRALREVLLDAGLSEGIKWSKPCYSHDGSNIAIMQEMKDFLALMFFKGALLEDPLGVLEDQGPNSRSAKRICFRSTDDVDRLADAVRQYVEDAIDVEAAGLEVGPPPALVLVDELQQRLDQDPELRTAFEALTPGRQREYHLQISGAKQSSTRHARVDRYVPKILAGKGLRDR
jgi:uncharacterized protein YdeI (YjbR/CyaY-like superfamily)